MITPFPFANKRVAVLGLGKSGRTAALALQRAGAQVQAWDDQLDARLNAEKEGVSLGDLYSIDWTSIDELVLSPGIPHHYPAPHPVVAKAKAAGVFPISDIEVLYRTHPEATYVGITGTNGKSTTTTLVAHMLKASGKRVEVGGNLGIPVMEFDPLSAGDIYVLEMSSYQLDITPSIHFHGAILLNITPDHLERHGGLDGYVEAKKQIFRHMTSHDQAFVGMDDPLSVSIAESLAVPVMPFSVHKSVSHGLYVDKGWLVDGRHGNPITVLDLGELTTLRGAHNWQNALAAYGLVTFLGVAPEVCKEALKTFPGLAHRQQMIARWENILFVNDSKATNADAVAQALETYKDETIYWLVGGRQKEGGIATLGAFFPYIHHAFLYGEARDAFEVTLKGQVPYTLAKDLKEAVLAAVKQARQENIGDGVVLLSPACASFDQFKSFEERGDAFVNCVNEIVGGRNTKALCGGEV